MYYTPNLKLDTGWLALHEETYQCRGKTDVLPHSSYCLIKYLLQNTVLCLSCYENVFTSCRSALGSSCLFVGFGRFGRLLLLLLTNSNDVNMDLPLTFLLLVSLAGRGGKRERQGKGRRTHNLSLCLGQETLLRGVGVLVGKE